MCMHRYSLTVFSDTCSGGFMLIVVPEQNREVATVVDFREVAPMAASKNMFHGNKSLASWVRKKW